MIEMILKFFGKNVREVKIYLREKDRWLIAGVDYKHGHTWFVTSWSTADFIKKYNSYAQRINYPSTFKPQLDIISLSNGDYVELGRDHSISLFPKEEGLFLEI